jgi:hypothetical protein
MKIRKGTWHAKVFRLMQDKVFAGGYDNGTNLCHYMRVVMLWAPLFGTFILIVCCAWLYAAVLLLFYIVFSSYGFSGVLIEWASLLAVGLFVWFVIPKLFHKAVAEDSIVRCAFERTKAAKRKVCPLVAFKDEA